MCSSSVLMLPATATTADTPQMLDPAANSDPSRSFISKTFHASASTTNTIAVVMEMTDRRITTPLSRI